MTTSISRLHALVVLAVRVLALLVLGACGLPGLLLNLPVLLVIDRISKAKAAEAKRKSAVKLEGLDVIATWKVLVSVFLFPALYVVCTAALWLYLRPVRRYHRLRICVAALFVVLPVFSYATMRILEVGRELLRSLRPLWYSLRAQSSGSALRLLRTRLRRQISVLIEEFGPLTVENFEQNRLVPRRKSSEGAGGAQQRPVLSRIPSFLESAGHEALEAVMQRYRTIASSLCLDMGSDTFSGEWESVCDGDIDDLFFSARAVPCRNRAG